MKAWSPRFLKGGRIPIIYTCMGKDISPPILWEDVPEDTSSFALIAYDPDAPGGTWIHWVIYNIPSTVRSLPEGLPAKAKLPDGTMQGRNDFGNIGYGGPCPPSGKPHRYFFTLYAIGSSIKLGEGITKDRLLREVKDSILSETKFYGIFSR